MSTSTIDWTKCQEGRSAEECEFLADIVICALEGGIGYWAQARTYKWWSPTLDGGTAEHVDGMSNAYAVIRVMDDDESNEWLAIDLDLIALGMKRMLAPGFRIRDDIASNVFLARKNCDAGEIDAEIADCIVQTGLFGEVEFG